MSLISNAVSIANQITKSLKLQSSVTWEVAVVAGNGAKTYPDGPVPLNAVVDWKQRQVLTRSGQVVTCRATITVLDPAIVVAFDDRITLSDGSTGPILTMTGPTDGATGLPAMREITIG